MLKGERKQAISSAHDEALDAATEALKILARSLRLDTERATAQTGLSMPMISVLSRLATLPEQTTVSELARALETNMGNLSSLLDRLEEAGYVQRITGEADRRARFVRLLPRGRQIVAKVSANFRNGRVCSALNRMSDAQLAEVTAMISSLNAIVKLESAH